MRRSCELVLVGRRSEGVERVVECVLELTHLLVPDVDIPLEVAEHLALHLVNLLEWEHILGDDGPRLVGVGVVAVLEGEEEGEISTERARKGTKERARNEPSLNSS